MIPIAIGIQAQLRCETRLCLFYFPPSLPCNANRVFSKEKRRNLHKSCIFANAKEKQQWQETS